MDPVTIALAAKVIDVLLPFVTKSAEEFASKVGDAVYEKAKTLLSTLRKKWSADPVATADLTRFEKNPQLYQAVLKQTLEEKLSEDKDLASELSRLLQEMGPALEVIQTIDEGKDITGLKAKEIKGGTARVKQDIKKAEGVTGAEIDTLG